MQNHELKVPVDVPHDVVQEAKQRQERTDTTEPLEELLLDHITVELHYSSK